VGRAGPDKWARRSPRKRGPTVAQNGWAELGPEDYFSLGWAEPGPYVWSGPNQVRPTLPCLLFLQKHEQLLFTFCMQPNGCRSYRRAEWSGRQPCGGEGAAVTGLEWSWWSYWWKKWWRCWLLVAEEERRRKSAEGERRPRGGCPLTPVRIWVHGEA